MIYAEYIARDRFMPWELFRYHGRQDWSAEGDRMVANLGRTMKVGPEPHYMCWWKIASVRRMDEWEEHFRTQEGRAYATNSPVARALNFYRCGLYDELIEGEIEPGLLHYVEFFESDGGPPSQTAEYFTSRRDGAGSLTYVIDRLGLLAPEPGGMALWSFESYEAAEPFFRRRPKRGSVRILSAGLYRNFGEDIP